MKLENFSKLSRIINNSLLLYVNKNKEDMTSREFQKLNKEFSVAIENSIAKQKDLYFEYEKSLIKKIKSIAGRNCNSILYGNSLYKVEDNHIVTAIYRGDTEPKFHPIYNQAYDTDPFCDEEGWDLKNAANIIYKLGDYLKNKY